MSHWMTDRLTGRLSPYSTCQSRQVPKPNSGSNFVSHGCVVDAMVGSDLKLGSMAAWPERLTSWDGILIWVNRMYRACTTQTVKVIRLHSIIQTCGGLGGGQTKDPPQVWTAGQSRRVTNMVS